MKRFLTAFVFPVLFFACTPSHDKPSTATNPPLVISQIDSLIERVHTDKGFFTARMGFTYDSKLRLSKIEGPKRDTAPDGYLNPAFDVVRTFNYSGSDTVPSGYSIQYIGLNVKDQPTEYYSLNYDAGKLLTDSMTDQSYSILTNFYFYPGKAFRLVSNSGPEDSLYFDQENMVMDSSMAVPVAGVDLSTWHKWTYGNDRNPLYIPSFASARLAVFFDFGLDFGSPNAVSSTTFIADPRAEVTWNYTWAKDLQGRIIRGLAVDPLTGILQDDVTFSYKN